MITQFLRGEEARDLKITLDFWEKEGHAKGAFFKTQIVGPVTLALHTKSGEEKNVLARAKRQVDEIRKRGWNPILFFDEPSLSIINPLILEKEKKRLQEMFHEYAAELDAVTGIHCCGRTNWDFLFGTGVDIISFDAAKDADHFFKNASGIRKHFENGRSIAWGLVPSTSVGYELDCKAVAETLIERIKKIAFPPLSLRHILLHSLVSTSCGTMGLSLEENRKAHEWVRTISSILSQQ